MTTTGRPTRVTLRIPRRQDPETDYASKLLSSKASKWIAGTAFHCYYGDPSAQTALHNQFPNKDIWFTECSGSHGLDDPPAKFFRDTLTWHARNITLGVTRNWSKTAVNWNIALDENGGPRLGGCGTCTGLVTTHPDGTVTTNAEYYTIGHLSKFVKPGAVRIASTSFGTTGWNGQIMDAAFRNPDASTALVVHNENDESRSFAVSVGSRTFEYTLPGGAAGHLHLARIRSARRQPGPRRYHRRNGDLDECVHGRLIRHRRGRIHPLVQRPGAVSGPEPHSRPGQGKEVQPGGSGLRRQPRGLCPQLAA